MNHSLKERVRKLQSKVLKTSLHEIPERLSIQINKAWDAGDMEEYSKLVWKWIYGTGDQVFIAEIIYKLEMAYGKPTRGNSNDIKEESHG